MASMNQTLYINTILKKFRNPDARPRSLPCDPEVYELLKEKSDFIENPTVYRELVGSLIYLMTGTRPDICYTVTLLSRFMNKPTKMHLQIAREVLNYLEYTKHYDLKYVRSPEKLQLFGYSYSDWARHSDFHSISGYCLKLNRYSALISWKSSKQTLIAASTCEAEYLALHLATSEALFLRQLFAEITKTDRQTVTIWSDNVGTIALAKHANYHSRTKHIDLKYHIVRDYIKRKAINVLYVPSQSNLADMATKPIKGPNMRYFSIIRGIIPQYMINNQ